MGHILSDPVPTFWPAADNSVWWDVENQVEALIDEKISDEVYNEVNNTLSGLSKAFEDYLGAVSDNDPSTIPTNRAAAIAALLDPEIAVAVEGQAGADDDGLGQRHGVLRDRAVRGDAGHAVAGLSENHMALLPGSGTMAMGREELLYSIVSARMPPSSSATAAAITQLPRHGKGGWRKVGTWPVFLDFDPEQGISAGREWERELYARILSCQAMVILCSEASMASRWCFMEITHARALGKPLFAIRIDDAKLDGVLADRQAIDLRNGEEQAFAQLMRGMTVAGLDPANAFRRDATRPPYPGMLAFEEEDAAVFFGRGEEIARGLELLNRIHHLGEPLAVMVLGGSGTGKSSLVRAGLIPRVRRNHEQWLVVGPVRPRTDPVNELASAVRRALEQSGAPRASQEIDRTLRDERATGLTMLLTELRRHSGHVDAKVLLVIDQFEELLTTERSDAAVVLRHLRHAMEHGDRGIVILGTMRSDFLDRFQSYSELVDLRYDALSLGPMSKEDIAEVITGPAREAEIELEPNLVEALIADGAMPGALPLLAFTLRELRERHGGDGKLTASEYRDGLGGLQSIVGRVAENVLTTARITSDDEQALRAAFMAMLRITADSRYVRRLRNWSDFPSRVHPLLERFVEARLLTSDTNGGKRTIEVAHERVFDSWNVCNSGSPRAPKRCVSERTSRPPREVTDAARDHATEDEYLWRGARVSRASELMSNGTLLLDESGRRFIQASHAAEEAEALVRERQRRRRSFSLAIFAAVAVVLAIFASIMAFRAQSNALRAKEAAERANEATGRAKEATGRARESALAADERAQIADADRARALTAQNFAEYQRVLLRAQEKGLDADVRKSLAVIAPKYQDQAKQYEATAQRMQQSLEEWRHQDEACRLAALVGGAPRGIRNSVSGSLRQACFTAAHPHRRRRPPYVS